MSGFVNNVYYREDDLKILRLCQMKVSSTCALVVNKTSVLHQALVNLDDYLRVGARQSIEHWYDDFESRGGVPDVISLHRIWLSAYHLVTTCITQLNLEQGEQFEDLGSLLLDVERLVSVRREEVSNNRVI